MKGRPLIFIIVLMALAGLAFILLRPSPDMNSLMDKAQKLITNPVEIAPPTLPYRASFAIYTHGTFRVFTASMYHNRSSDAYITAQAPNTITVTARGITWDDFFKTLPFKLTTDCLTTGLGEQFCSGQNGTLKFYLNAKLALDILGQTIQPGDKLLVSYGNNTEQEIRQQNSRVPDPEPRPSVRESGN